MAKTDTKDAVNKAAIGVGLAAVAAGAYFFFGPDGKKHQKKMKGWMVKMKGEVLEKIEDMQELTEPLYNQIVDAAAKAQAVNGKIPKDEIMDLAMELKKQWKVIKKGMNGDAKKTKSVAKKTVRAAKSAK